VPVEEAGATPGSHVRARLTRLALLPAADGPGTTDRVLAVNRHRRQRAARWVAGALTVVVLGTAATLTRPAEVVAAAAPATAPAGVRAPAVYEQPARGSLADDPSFLARAAGLSWSDPADPEAGSAWQVESGTSRAVYAADVPGGHRWAVVMARWRSQWAVAWFTGPAGSPAEDLTLAAPPTPWSGRGPLALMDVTGPRGPLLVLAEPGVSAEYSPSLDRAPDGRLVRDFEPLPRFDGVLLGWVTTPITWTAGEVHQVRDDVAVTVPDLLITGEPPWPDWFADSGAPVDDAVLGPCLTALGFDVDDGPGAGDLQWSLSVPTESSRETAAREQAAADCRVRARTP
jgi:hypothetical protein